MYAGQLSLPTCMHARAYTASDACRVHVRMCACVHVRMYVHVCMCARAHVCMCACAHVRMCACVHVCAGQLGLPTSGDDD